MDRSILQALVVGFLALLLVLMALGWRARKRRQRDIAPLPVAPTELGELFADIGGKYVATTTAGAPLDRIAVHGLGFRANCTVQVASTGILVRLPGRDLWIAASAILTVQTATWTIDRVVEPGGLHVIEWMLGDHAVDTYLRMADPKEFERAATRALDERRTA